MKIIELHIDRELDLIIFIDQKSIERYEDMLNHFGRYFDYIDNNCYICHYF